MKTPRLIFHPVFVFILAQLAWLSLVGLWIYWYVSNYIILEQVEDKLSPQIISKSTNIIALVSGCFLLVVLLGGMYFIFIYLTRQINITRMYDNFIANVTHELKSPLASIQLYLETMKYRKLTADRQKEFINLMMKDAHRLKQLISSILDISSIEQKKMAYHYKIYSAESLITELVREVETQFKLTENSIQITGEAPCKCVVDRNAFKTVFTNLIENAIKYSPKHPQIIVNMGCNSRSLFIEIIDKGIGISQADQKKIFDKFYRIYGRDIPNIKGTGLGLFMVKEVVKVHGGKISVKSRGRNRGSTFRVELPVFQMSKKHYINKLLNLTKKKEKERTYQYDQESV